MARAPAHSFLSLVEPAFEIVAQEGLDALTLRPLAQRAGITLSRMTHMVGSKSALLRQLIEEARQADALQNAPVLDLVAGSKRLDGTELAEICDLALDVRAQSHRHIALFFCEAIQAAANDPDIAQALQPWLDDQRAFWRQVAGRAADADADLLAEALLCFSIDEMAHGCALRNEADYRRLRRLCLQRLCRGRIVWPESQHNGALFAWLFDALGEIEDPIAIDRSADLPWDAKAATYAAAASHVLVHQGAGALTHRAVAEVAGVASSSLAYHFKTSEDLIKGAMAFIIRRLKGAIGSEPQLSWGLVTAHPAYEISRATYALALEASRRPVFLASAADMRRKRGVNLQAILNAQLGEGRSVDFLAAQTLSIASIGAVMLHSPKGIEAAMAQAQDLMQRLMAT